MDYSLIFQAVTKVYKECHITSLPFDYFKVLRHYGFQIYTYDELMQKNLRLYQICVSYTADAFKYEKTIAYNSDVYPRRMYFTLMHELGHLLLGHLEETSENEEEANAFASNLLASRILIHRFGCRTANSIYEIFGLSHVASVRALADYKDWYYRISQQPAPRSPSEPELLLEKLFFPKQKKTKPAKPVAAPETATATVQAEYNDSISDKQLFEHLKNSLIERSKAAGLELSIDEYLMYKYNFKF